MGLSFGGNTGGASSNTATTGQSSSTPTYTPGQSSMQGTILDTLNNLIKGSGSPQIQAMQTQSADQINSEYSSMGDKMNRFLAARGFGRSGQAGQTVLKTELGRQGALAGNTANYGKMALDEQNTALSDALYAAYTNPGKTETGSATASGNSSNWSFGAGTSFGIPGIPKMSVPKGF